MNILNNCLFSDLDEILYRDEQPDPEYCEIPEEDFELIKEVADVIHEG